MGSHCSATTSEKPWGDPMLLTGLCKQLISNNNNHLSMYVVLCNNNLCMLRANLGWWHNSVTVQMTGRQRCFIWASTYKLWTGDVQNFFYSWHFNVVFADSDWFVFVFFLDNVLVALIWPPWLTGHWKSIIYLSVCCAVCAGCRTGSRPAWCSSLSV